MLYSKNKFLFLNFANQVFISKFFKFQNKESEIKNINCCEFANSLIKAGVGGLTSSFKNMKKRKQKGPEPNLTDLRRAIKINANLAVDILCHLITLEKHLEAKGLVDKKRFRDDYFRSKKR